MTLDDLTGERSDRRFEAQLVVSDWVDFRRQSLS